MAAFLHIARETMIHNIFTEEEKTDRMVQDDIWKRDGIGSMMKKWFHSLPDTVVQFAGFGMIGALNTVLSYGITNISYYTFHLHEQISNIIAFLITVFISYVLNSRFVFHDRSQPWYIALGKVYASYAFTELIIMGILLFVEERIFGVPHYIATFFNLAVTIPLNFLLNKFWAYRKNKGADYS